MEPSPCQAHPPGNLPRLHSGEHKGLANQEYLDANLELGSEYLIGTSAAGLGVDRYVTSQLQWAAKIAKRPVASIVITGGGAALSAHALLDILIFVRHGLLNRGRLLGVENLAGPGGLKKLGDWSTAAGFNILRVSNGLTKSPTESIQLERDDALPVLGFKEKIYVVGDSHCRFYAGKDDIRGGVDVCEGAARAYSGFSAKFVGLHIGSAAAGSLALGDAASVASGKVASLIANYIPKGSTVAFSFGELDCRNQICQGAASTGRTIKAEAIAVADRYLSYLEQFEASTVRPAVALPSSVTTLEHWGDPENPIFGSQSQRLEAMRTFNAYMNEKTVQRGIRTLDLFESVNDPKGNPKAEYFCNPFNLSQAARPFLQDLMPDGVF